MASTRVHHEGLLYKRGHMVKNWKIRLFRLSWSFDEGYSLAYYVPEGTDAAPRGGIHVGRQTSCQPSSLRPSCLEINSGGSSEPLFIAASSPEECEEWQQAIAAAIADATGATKEEERGEEEIHDDEPHVIVRILRGEVREENTLLPRSPPVLPSLRSSSSLTGYLLCCGCGSVGAVGVRHGSRENERREEGHNPSGVE